MNIVKLNENRRKQDLALRDQITTQEEAHRLNRVAILMDEMTDVPKEQKLRMLAEFSDNGLAAILALAGRKAAEILLDWETKKQSEGN